MDQLLLRINLKTEDLRLESRSFLGQSKLIYYKLVSYLYFVFYLGYYATLWITGIRRLSVFIIRKKKEVNILQYSDYDYIY
jgi:hypothetical protein